MTEVTDQQLIDAVKEHGTASSAARALDMSERTARERVKRLRANGMAPLPLAPYKNGKYPKVLIYDIETSPNLAFVWGTFKQTISPSQMVVTTDVMCWAAKWLGEKAILVESRQKDDGDERISRELWTLFDQADVVVAHNGNNFDQKIMRARWVLYGMDPPSPYKQVDTLNIAKSFRFPRNKLETLGTFFGIGNKLEHEGFSLWVKCMNGDRDAWKRMMDYNVQDVVLLEKLYLKIRAWDTRAPNLALYYDDDQTRCVVCGSTSLKDIPQNSYTALSEFYSARCRGCGKVMRYGKRIKPSREMLRNVI